MGISVLLQVGMHSWTFSSTQVLLCASVRWSREEKVPFTVIASESEKHSDTSDQVLPASTGVCILQISTTRENIKILAKLDDI